MLVSWVLERESEGRELTRLILGCSCATVVVPRGVPGFEFGAGGGSAESEAGAAVRLVLLGGAVSQCLEAEGQ